MDRNLPSDTISSGNKVKNQRYAADLSGQQQQDSLKNQNSSWSDVNQNSSISDQDLGRNRNQSQTQGQSQRGQVDDVNQGQWSQRQAETQRSQQYGRQNRDLRQDNNVAEDDMQELTRENVFDNVQYS
ncbi:hypothetical protein BX616_001997 [Lobosporangium transversale]|uniref:Uncharacterized protein n=1 Tax=Lobosporangium transversale TaxID=64571 RepID=A0A1Y2GZQ2_9FUNG|nr:hypothetical protein BCR41DRAFT_392240 [Lobosporangium transversale]KAF9902239.1 hypothetical protein BX616_001997 [Lobosporangium transversale]ORZ27787.1 hypothetical protein BCR41DRAFT_392240 [Lobosporangium transversale]|eukprot:XP_021885490.1 hypothetical protein BCR41DRAFT_392240 [Lobosporangium transversale]